MFLSWKCCFKFCTFGFEAIPHPSCSLTSIIQKVTIGQSLVLFLCNFCRFFSCVGAMFGGVLVTNLFSLLLIYIYFGYSANYNTRGAFMIIFLICSNLLNWLRIVDTIAIQQKVAETASKSFSLSNSSQNAP